MLNDNLYISYCSAFLLQSSHDCYEISLLIQQHRLEDCLDFIEKLGYVGDTAIFVLACLQLSGARA